MAAIRIVVTGGTFDKEYNELTGALAFKDTHLPEMLRLGRSRVDVSIHTLMMIDSLDMTAADRALIVEKCRRAEEARILLFNLGSAISFVQVLPPGVYLAMNGRCFEWNRVRKNKETGVFESL